MDVFVFCIVIFCTIICIFIMFNYLLAALSEEVNIIFSDKLSDLYVCAISCS